MSLYTLQELIKTLEQRIERGEDANDTMIVTIWSRQDFPEAWGRIVAAYSNRWDDALMNVQGDALEVLCEEIGINLRDENARSTKGPD